jgi:RimJ/RimL family protein N-acetyltransferase
VSAATLVTPRLVLRDFRPTDFRAVQLYAADTAVVRFMLWGPNSDAETRAFLQRAAQRARATPRTHWELAVTDADTGDLVGGAAVRIDDAAHESGSMGYVIRRDRWGRGYATEAARAVLGLGFERLGLHRIEARCVPENVASERVLQKLGMRLEGRLRENYRIRGAWCDSMVYTMLRTEWDAR